MSGKSPDISRYREICFEWGDDYYNGNLGLYNTGILSAITPLGRKGVRCYSHLSVLDKAIISVPRTKTVLC